jgi:hypothetical protein
LPPRIRIEAQGGSHATIVTDFAFLPNGQHALVLAKNGVVYLYENTGTGAWNFGKTPGLRPFILLNTKVRPAIGDCGLVAIDFDLNGYIYLAYVGDLNPDCQGPGRVCAIKRNKIR